MKKFLIVIIIGLIIFTGCNMHDSSSGINARDLWFYDSAVQVASTFGYNLYDDPRAAIGQPNYFTGRNERTGICIDYAVTFAVLTDSFVVFSPPYSFSGIYKIVDENTPVSRQNNAQSSNNRIRLESWDKTEAWYLEKIGEFHSYLFIRFGNPTPSHAWNYTKDNYLIDTNKLDFVGPDVNQYSSWCRKLK